MTKSNCFELLECPTTPHLLALYLFFNSLKDVN